MRERTTVLFSSAQSFEVFPAQNSIPQPLIHGHTQSTCQASGDIVGCSCADGCIERKLPTTAGRGGFIG